ncbi:hypothetical protein [Martelella sp. HB161492]|uniref:hypothetical protein n=1 Tax=Martelella sp. HB161492 TaxID=2720726 RepID=UPI001590CA89|nr:hypothetical protein [Martelella sp. HB161492]
MLGTEMHNQPAQTLGANFPPEQVRDELARILASNSFRATPRRRRLLEYIVEEVLAGRGHMLKGYAIGLAVFDRKADFDPQADAVVRLEARRLRHDLDGYYAGDGAKNRLRIMVPKGQYNPLFCLQHPEEDAAVAPEPPDRDEGSMQPLPPAPRWHRPRMLFWSVFVLALSGILVWNMYFIYREKGWDTGLAQAGSRPAVAVLPFVAISSEPDQERVAIGVSDRIATALSTYPDYVVFLSPFDSSASNDDDYIERADKRGIRYLVEGRVQTEGQSFAVNAFLVDTRTKQILWSKTYLTELGEAGLMETQTDIAKEIATEVSQPYGAIRTEVTRGAKTAGPNISGSFRCVLEGYAYRRDFSRQGFNALSPCLEKAVVQDPGYAEAWAMLAWVRLDGGRFGYLQNPDKMDIYGSALTAAANALALDRTEILGLKAMSSINHYMGNFAESEDYARQALALNPYDPDSLAQLGWRLSTRGRFDEGIPYLNAAIARTASAPGWYYYLIAVDDYLDGNYREMLNAAEHSAVDRSGFGLSLLATAYGALGNQKLATDTLSKMAVVDPEFNRDPAGFYRSQQATEEIVEALMAGLEKAGWKPPSNRAAGG